MVVEYHNFPVVLFALFLFIPAACSEESDCINENIVENFNIPSIKESDIIQFHDALKSYDSCIKINETKGIFEQGCYEYIDYIPGKILDQFEVWIGVNSNHGELKHAFTTKNPEIIYESLNSLFESMEQEWGMNTFRDSWKKGTFQYLIEEHFSNFNDLKDIKLSLTNCTNFIVKVYHEDGFLLLYRSVEDSVIVKVANVKTKDIPYEEIIKIGERKRSESKMPKIITHCLRPNQLYRKDNYKSFLCTN